MVSIPINLDGSDPVFFDLFHGHDFKCQLSWPLILLCLPIFVKSFVESDDYLSAVHVAKPQCHLNFINQLVELLKLKYVALNLDILKDDFHHRASDQLF